jgi:hypothetical protein
MTPKEKAEELVSKFYWRKTNHNVSVIDSKQLALIAVDEIINTGLLEGTTTGVLKKYWKEVKQEIEEL